MNDVFELVKKNLKNLIRAKASSIIVILGPLIIIFLAGLAFDTSDAYAVKIGAYTQGQTDDTKSVLDQLRGQFQVTDYDNEEECVDAIKNTDVNTCMSFAEDFAIGKPPNNRLTFHVDPSRVNLVWTIMSVMRQEVGERSEQASKNFTTVIVETLEYTHDQITQQRETLVRLTTENELINRNAQDLIAELGDMDLRLNENIGLDNLTKANTQVKQWVDNALELGNEGLSEAVSFIDAADSAVKSSGEGNDDIIQSFQQSVEDIEALKADMEQTQELTRASFERFEQQLSTVATGIQNTKAKLNEADTSRELSLRVLEAIRTLLDKSLLNVLQVQQSFNDIDNRIQAIEITDPGAITEPIATTIKPVVEEKTYLNYLFPVLIVLVIMFTALLVTPTLVLLEKNSPASFRTYMTPVSDTSYLLATFITSFLILFMQVLIILAIASIFFAGQVITNAPEALFLLIIVNSFFILVGMIIGYCFNTEETVTLAAVSVGSVFLFISDVIIPIESMPTAFNYIAGFNPYVLGSNLLRRALLFDSSIISLAGDTLILVGYIIATAFLVSGTYYLTRNYTLQQLIQKVSPVLERMHIRKRK